MQANDDSSVMMGIVLINSTAIRMLFFIAFAFETTGIGNYNPNLPILYIESKDKIMGNLEVPCTAKMLCPEGFEHFNTNLLSGRIKIRGRISRGYPKKSYALELDQSIRLLNMRKDDDWILNSAYIDRSLIRHKLSFDLFKSLSSKEKKRFAVESRFIEVYINGTYRGVYLLMERVDAKLVKLKKYSREDAYHSCIYKAVNHAANFEGTRHRGYTQKEPKRTVQIYWKPLDKFNRFVLSSTEEEFFHPETVIQFRLDIENAIDFHLLVLVTSNYDGITKNFYFSRDGQQSGPLRKRFFFTPWDYDGTFGRNWNSTITRHSDWLSNNLFTQLLSSETYRKQFIARWNYLHKRQFSVKAIHSLIDQYVLALGKSARRNFIRWPANAYIYADKVSFEDDIAHIKSWTEYRINWLHQEINQNLSQHY